jgi:hypothetical protein
MRAPTCRVFLAALLAAPPPAPAAAADDTIELRVVAHAAVEPRALRLARATVGDLLEPAGARVAWRDCPAEDTGCVGTGGDDAIVVRVVPTRPSTQRLCGGVVAGPRGPVILVFLSCHERLVETLRTRAGARSEPSLATLEIGHLLGLTVAHELGHVLGLAHGPGGVMRRRFDIADIVALRSAGLDFRPAERQRIRQVLLARAARRIANATPAR